MMGFCVNLFTVDENFEMGPRWIFLLMDNFLLMVTNFTGTCFHLSKDYLCLICNGRKRERERERETENYLIEDNFFREKFQGFFFLDFVTFSLRNIFLTKIIYSRRKISLPKILPNKHDFRRHIDLCNKKLKE